MTNPQNPWPTAPEGPGRYAPERQPFYRNGAFVGVCLLFCFPVGLWLMWSNKLWSKPVRWAISGVLAVLALVQLTRPRSSSTMPAKVAEAVPAAAKGDPVRAVSEERRAASEEPRANAAAPVFVTQSCLDLATRFGPGSKLSDLQKEELWPRFDGKAFEWKLEITDVSSGLLGGYLVQAKCSPKSPSLIQDVAISYDAEDKEFVLGLEKEHTYVLKGTLTHTSTLMGLSAKGMR